MDETHEARQTVASPVLRRISVGVQSRRFSIVVILVGVGLALPALFVGIQADDYFIRNTVLGLQPPDTIRISRWETYSYLDGVPANNDDIIDRGYMPWWTDLECRTSFARPLTALTQMFDYYLWPTLDMAMHVHSLIWFGALLGVVTALCRRLSAHPLSTVPVWVGGFGALLFAIDDRHAIPASWLANRNALIAGCFGIAAVLLHDCWRRSGRHWAGIIAALSLLLGLLGKEEAVSAGGYLLAYAVFLDRGRWRGRLAALLPYIAVGLGWLVWYKLAGYGARYSGVYLDPIHDPLAFMARVVRNAPVLLLGQWALPPADLQPFESAWLFQVHWLVAVSFIVLLGALFAPLLKADPVARFWAVGMLLATLPVCAIFPSDRLLLFPSLGAAGLLASWLVRRDQVASAGTASQTGTRVARAVAGFLMVLHLVLAPLAMPIRSLSIRFAGGFLDTIQDTLPADDAVRSQHLVIASTFTALADMAWFQRGIARGLPRPRRTLNLNASSSPATLTRLDRHTLRVRPLGGYLKPDGWRGPNAPAFSSRYLGRHLDRLTRSSARPLKRGDRIHLTLATITISDITEDGRPAEATFRFHLSIDDPVLRWVYAAPDGYHDLTPPKVGETIEVPSP